MEKPQWHGEEPAVPPPGATRVRWLVARSRPWGCASPHCRLARVHHDTQRRISTLLRSFAPQKRVCWQRPSSRPRHLGRAFSTGLARPRRYGPGAAKLAKFGLKLGPAKRAARRAAAPASLVFAMKPATRIQSTHTEFPCSCGIRRGDGLSARSPGHEDHLQGRREHSFCSAESRFIRGDPRLRRRHLCASSTTPQRPQAVMQRSARRGSP